VGVVEVIAEVGDDDGWIEIDGGWIEIDRCMMMDG